MLLKLMVMQVSWERFGCTDWVSAESHIITFPGSGHRENS